ncbi:hypothetical protein LMG33818_000773 [Halomonadaceae bacterium LMG 33818]|uniref:hypothetical protein n=1 Tax=Cernens ardua TaxID=3402176 RepID=UPI003EDBE1D6
MKKITTWLTELHKGSRVTIQQGETRQLATVEKATQERIFVAEYPGFFHRDNGQHVLCFYHRAQLVPAGNFPLIR